MDSIKFFNAISEDLPEIIALLADDTFGQHRETTKDVLDSSYITAFNEITSDSNNEIIVGKINDKVVALLQITYIPNLTFKGSKRAQIEGVRVNSSLRGKGIGRKMFAFVLDRARSKGCKLIQLTTNKERPEALQFYESIGFKATHFGLKLEIK